MDAKEVKKALKSAREAIRTKDYKEALKHCKDILKIDKNNYNALVFVGVAAEGLDQMEQAHMAYKKAVEINEDNVLGWQGLCGFYEKTAKPENTVDLISVYRKLIELHQSDLEKCCEIKLKLIPLLVRRRDVLDEAVVLCESLADQVVDIAQRKEILQHYVSLYPLIKSPTDEQNIKVINAYQELTQEGTGPDIWKQYLQILIKNGRDNSELLSVANRFCDLHPSVWFPWELQARITLDTSAQDDVHMEHAGLVSGLLEGLTAAGAESGYADMLRGVLAMREHTYLQALTLLSEGVRKTSTCVGGWFFLGRLAGKIHRNSQAYKAAKEASRLLARGGTYYGDKTRLERELQLLIATVCIEMGDQTHLEQATNIIDKLLEGDAMDAVYIIQAKLQIALQQPQKSLPILEKVTGDTDQMHHSLKGWSHYLLKEIEIAKSCLTTALANEDTSMAHYYMARIIFDSETQDIPNSCLTHLLKAAKLDPFHSATFLYLGHYYGKVLNDQSKSSRCYQKAYDLDHSSEEAGTALIDCLMAAGNKDQALGILKTVTSSVSAGSGKWAWLRLGLYQMGDTDPTCAIISLQNALRADPKDVHCWECLGEAYMMRGSYTAALKAFTRATELDQSAFFCYYQLATIKQTLCLYDEAVVEYCTLLKKTDYVPALKGLGETYLHMARAAMKDFFHGRAVTYCEEALGCLTKAASERPDLSCVWKLLGDICTLLGPVPESKISLLMPTKLISQSDISDEKVKVTKQDILSVGSRCYGMAVKLRPDCASLWQDLGINYFHQSKINEKTKRRLLTGKSVQCLQKAVQVDPGNFRHWNALGVVSASDMVRHPGLAQHCFIKSVDAEANNVTAWTNLGILYLKSDEVKLAHEAFKVAQSLEPSYVACWVGQSLIAEVVGDEEAMDLFRHTTELGNQVEGAVGYAHWVCRALQDSGRLTRPVLDYAIRKMAAIPAASDALAKYLDRVQDDAVAYNMYGLLLERQGLYSMACAAFQSAVELLDCRDQAREIKDICINYARVLCSADRAEESVEQYKKLSDLDTVDMLAGLGLAFCKCSRYEESIDSYQRALQLADTIAEQSHIHAAIGMVAYRMGDLPKAKGALFSGSQLETPSVRGLQALLGIGVLEKDDTLCTAVLQELDKLSDGTTDVITETLAGQVQLLGGHTQEAIRYIERVLHAHPDRENLWTQLAHHLLRQDTARPSASLRCLLKAQLTDNGGTLSVGKKGIFTEDASILLGLSSLGAGNHDSQHRRSNAMGLAQKAVHSDPSSLENWCVLLGAVHAQQNIRPTDSMASLMLSFITRLMARVEGELSGAAGDKSRLQQLHAWCVKHYVVVLLGSGRKDQAQQFLQQAAWLYEHDTHLQILTAAFNQDFSRLKHLAGVDSSGLASEVLISLYEMHGLTQEAEKAYNTWLKNTTTTQGQLRCTVQHAYFAFKNLGTATAQSATVKWESTFKDAVNTGLKLDPNCSLLWLMQALVSLNDTKLVRFVKRSLHQVIDRTTLGALPHAVALALLRLQELSTEDTKGDGKPKNNDPAKDI